MDERKRKRSSSPASASGTKKHAVSSNSLVKVSTDFSTKKKNDVASASEGEVVASYGGKKDVVGSQGLVTGANDSDQSKDTNSDEDPPEEIFQKHSFKGRRNNFAKNPHQCPDLNDMFEWTGKEKKEYRKWVWFESGRRGLSREEQAYLQTFGVNQDTGRKTSIRR